MTDAPSISQTTKNISNSMSVSLPVRIVSGMVAAGFTSWVLTYCSLHGMDFKEFGLDSETVKSGITGIVTGILTAPESIPIAIAAFVIACRIGLHKIWNGFTSPLPPDSK